MNVRNLSTIHLEDLRDQTEIDLVNISSQIEDAKSEAKATGEYSDRQWFNSARHAKRMKGAFHQQVLRELGERSRKAKRDEQREINDVFVNVAKERLSPDVFQSCMALALQVSGVGIK